MLGTGVFGARACAVPCMGCYDVFTQQCHLVGVCVREPLQFEGALSCTGCVLLVCYVYMLL
jgi:hypothetical protein